MIYAYSEKYILPISHDEVVHGKQSLLSKMPGDDWQKKANFRLYLTFMMGHPGKKLLFMSNEFGQWEEWNVNYSINWQHLEYEFHQQLQTFCRALNHFYLDSPVLYRNDFDPSGFEWIDLHDHHNSVYSFIRRGKPSDDDAPYIFVFNFTPVPRDNYTVGVPDAGRYQIVFNSDGEEFGGSEYGRQKIYETTNKEWHGRPHQISLNLPPLAALVLQLEEA